MTQHPASRQQKGKGPHPGYEFMKADDARRVGIPRDIFTARDTCNNLFRISVTFKATTPIHVGCGKKEVDKKNNEIILLITCDKNGQPFIPGSSLKGMASTNYLALSASIRDTSELFGTTTQSAAISKVFFEPVYPTTQTKVDLEELERGWRPKEGLEKRVKYYMQQKPESENPQYQQIEAIPEGTELATSITGVGLREYEIGGLLMSIGINASESGALSSMPVKIGYGKPQGFGQMAAQTNTLAIIQHVQSILSFTPENITSDAARMVKAFKQRVRQNAPWKPVDSDYQKLFSWRD